MAVPVGRLTVNRKIFMLIQAFAIFWIIGSVTLTSALPTMKSETHARISKRSFDNSDDRLSNRIRWIDRFSRGCTGYYMKYNCPAIKNLSEELLGVFGRENQPGHQLKPINSAKNLYKACNNYHLSPDSPASDPDWSRLREILKMFGGWPAVEGNLWSEKNKYWRELQTKLLKTAFDGFVEIHDFIFMEAIIVLPIKSIFDYTRLKNGVNNPVVIEYRDKLVDIAVKMGANRDSAKKEIDDAIKLDSELPGKVWWANSYFKKISHILIISEADQRHIWPLNINPDTDPMYIQNGTIEEIRNKLDGSPLRVIFNHAMMRMALELISFSKDQLKRREECTNFMSTKLRDIQEIIYMQTNQDNATLKKNINNVPETSSQSALKEQHHKFTSISEIRDQGKIAAYYRDLEEIKEDNFLDGIQKLIRFRFDHRISIVCPCGVFPPKKNYFDYEFVSCHSSTDKTSNV